jgi:hypothetical protein
MALILKSILGCIPDQVMALILKSILGCIPDQVLALILKSRNASQYALEN